MQSATIARPRSGWWTRVAGVQSRTVLFWLTIIATITRTGAYWDVQWHAVVGRDSFWIPPHDLIYSGVAISGLIGLFMVLREGFGRRWARPLPWSWLLVMAGAGCLVGAAPFDDLWHRLYGIDVTIWSPPHMVGVLGAWLIDAGLIAGWSQEVRSANATTLRTRSLLGLAWAGALLVSMVNFGLVPAVRWSATQPVAPTLYALLGSLLLPAIFVVVTYAGGRWWLPLAMLGALGMLRALDLLVHSFSIAVVVPLYAEHLRGSPEAISRHLWFHLLLNIAPVLAVSGTTLLLRQLGRTWAAVTGLFSGGMIMLGIVVLRSGWLIPVFPARIGRDYRVEAVPFINLFGRSDAAAWLYALLGGLLSGLIGWGLARMLTRSQATLPGVEAAMQPRRESVARA